MTTKLCSIGNIGLSLLIGMMLVCAAPSSLAQASNAKLIVFGDSLSAGYGFDPQLGWVNLLQQKLKQLDSPFEVVNTSVSGETTTGGLARLAAMLQYHKPSLVILQLGGNDGLRGLPLSHIKQNLITMSEMIQDSGAQLLLAGIQIPPNYGPRYTQPFFEQFAEIAESLNLPLVPFLIDGIPQRPELMQDDGIHPKAEAQHMILDNVWPILAPMVLGNAISNWAA